MEQEPKKLFQQLVEIGRGNSPQTQEIRHYQFEFASKQAIRGFLLNPDDMKTSEKLQFTEQLRNWLSQHEVTTQLLLGNLSHKQTDVSKENLKFIYGALDGCYRYELYERGLCSEAQIDEQPSVSHIYNGYIGSTDYVMLFLTRSMYMVLEQSVAATAERVPA